MTVGWGFEDWVICEEYAFDIENKKKKQRERERERKTEDTYRAEYPYSS
jgi:hypothetical protein